MRRHIFAFISFLSLICAFVESKAIFQETNDFSHVLNYADEGTLFVFDLDNTLIETAQHLGSDQWVTHKLNYFIEQGVEADEALRRVLGQLIEVQNRTEMRLVDPSISNLLHTIQKKKMPIVGLTKRNPCLSERTLEQLAALQIDFKKTAHIQQELIFEELEGTVLKQGIIFVGHGIEKGPALTAYLNKLNKTPKKIVVVDDKLGHIQNIAGVLEPLEIDLVGIRYGGADEKVKSFNPKIADVQWEHLQKILSDEQAMHLIQLKNHSVSTGE